MTFNGFELFFSEKTFVGSYYGSADVRSDFNRMLRLWKNGRLDLEGMIVQEDRLGDVNEAVADLKAGRSSARSSPSTRLVARGHAVRGPLAAPPRRRRSSGSSTRGCAGVLAFPNRARGTPAARGAGSANPAADCSLALEGDELGAV